MLAINIVEIAYYWTYAYLFNDEDYDCAYEAKAYLATIYCLLYTICLYLSWQDQLFFRQVEHFVRKGILPSERSKRRNKMVAVLIELLAFC